jgi:hypothetical protein
MEYQQAANVLKTLLAKYPLTDEEKEAVQTAMGLLTLGALSKSHLASRLKAEKAKKDKQIKW